MERVTLGLLTREYEYPVCPIFDWWNVVVCVSAPTSGPERPGLSAVL